MGTHLIGEMHLIVKKGELNCSIMFVGGMQVEIELELLVVSVSPVEEV